MPSCLGMSPPVLVWWSVMTASTQFGVMCVGMGTSGSAWFRVYLPEEVTVAILKIVHPNALYFVIGGLTAHTFENKTDLGEWLEAGFAACEGSEQRRYASMMNQVDVGKFVIDYDA